DSIEARFFEGAGPLGEPAAARAADASAKPQASSSPAAAANLPPLVYNRSTQSVPFRSRQRALLVLAGTATVLTVVFVVSRARNSRGAEPKTITPMAKTEGAPAPEPPKSVEPATPPAVAQTLAVAKTPNAKTPEVKTPEPKLSDAAKAPAITSTEATKSP